LKNINDDLSRSNISTWNSWVLDFENFVLNQEPAKPETAFDQNYFEGTWRHGSESYTLESRRKIEGRNPELIKSVLNPMKLLDAGCGPGFLMQMLKEIEVEVVGIDASPAGISSAPVGVRDKIVLGSVLDLPFKDKEFDVVLSREVLEHLTVIELHKAISEMCRVSSRLVYVTTRFAQNPKSLFDVETEFDADPTHITCMVQPLVRAIFNLHGYKVRPDLQNEMDWLNKGRVLVYERTEKALS
jgi:SAM-dependent methyltransferase